MFRDDTYYIILTKNKKRIKTLHRSKISRKILIYWKNLNQHEPPDFPIIYQSGKRVLHEIILVGPESKFQEKYFLRDEMGRLIDAQIPNTKLKLRNVAPYPLEEKIFDYDNKIHIFIDELVYQLRKIKEISQIYTLNKHIVLFNDVITRVFTLKNISDCQRCFYLIRKKLEEHGRGNFLFVRDVSTHQRKILYSMLEARGYEKEMLKRHYTV